MDLTGVFVRINRNGKWQNMDLAELGREELMVFLAGKDKVWVDKLVLILLGHAQ